MIDPFFRSAHRFWVCMVLQRASITLSGYLGGTEIAHDPLRALMGLGGLYPGIGKWKMERIRAHA